MIYKNSTGSHNQGVNAMGGERGCVRGGRGSILFGWPGDSETYQFLASLSESDTKEGLRGRGGAVEVESRTGR